MRTVWKFTFAVGPEEQVKMPASAVCVGADASSLPDRVDLWFDLYTTAPSALRSFYVTGTGHNVPDEAVHVATVRHQESRLVWHVWELWRD